MVSQELRILLAFLVSYLSVLFIIPKLSSIAQAIGLIDRPNARKIHTEPRPLVGGIGIVIAATFSALLLVPLGGFRGLFLGLAVLLLVGFLDDFRELNPRQKFLAQIGSCVLAMYFSKMYLSSFGDLLGFGSLDLPYFQPLVWLVTIFCVVGVINAINLIDGLDGLAGGVVFIAFLSFALHASFAGAHVLMLINLSFAGAVLGFLRFNWNPAMVFMGDAGSMCLGFVLAFMAIVMSQGEARVFSPVIPLLVLAVPITDTIVVMSRRALHGRSPFSADQHHVHHIFMRYGMNRDLAVKTILALSLLFSGITLLAIFYPIPDYLLFGIFGVYFVCYAIISSFIVVLMRFSLKYRRETDVSPKQKRTARLARSLLNRIDILKIFRKDTRYPVELEMTCRLRENSTSYNGYLANISRRGCMARIPLLTNLCNKVIIGITCPLDEGYHTLELPAEHVWTCEIEGERLHGFKFQELRTDDRSVFLEFMVRFDRKHGEEKKRQ